MVAFKDKTIKWIFTCIGGNESINWSEIKMIQKEEQKVYDTLNSLKIKYARYEHKPIYTVKEGKKLDISIPGKKCKNLFLKNGNGNINYIVILDEDKSINLKFLAKEIGIHVYHLHQKKSYLKS